MLSHLVLPSVSFFLHVNCDLKAAFLLANQNRENYKCRWFIVDSTTKCVITAVKMLLADEVQTQCQRQRKSTEDMILALAGQFKQLSHEPEKFR